jgi:hypothetical protein
LFAKRRSVLGQACVVEINGAYSDTIPFFYGITASKKVGNAVKRNKAKRRIRALIKPVLDVGVWGGVEGPEAFVSKFCLKNAPNHLKKTVLSKKTLQTFFEKSKMVQHGDKNIKNIGIAFVFIATKLTPVVKWEKFESDFREIVRESLNCLGFEVL